MTIHTVWTGDAKQAKAEVGSLERANVALTRKIEQLTGKSMAGARAGIRARRQEIKTAQDAGKAVDRLEREHAKLLAQHAKARGAVKAREAAEKKAAIAQREAARKQALEEQRLTAIRKRLYEETRTPQERYAAKMRELNALVRRGAIDQETYRRAARRAAQEQAAASGQAKAASGAVASWGRSLAGVAAGYFSVQTAIQAVISALREEQEIRRSLKEQQVSIAQAERAARMMLPETVSTEEYDKVARQIAQQVKPAEGIRAVHQVMQDTLSAAGELRKGAEAARLGLEFAPSDVEMAKGLGGGALDIAMGLGTENVRAALGWLIAGTQKTRVTTPQEVAKYATPAMAGMLSTGVEPSEAMGLYSALTKYGDIHGRISKTGAVTITEAFKEFFPEEPEYAKTGKLKRKGYGKLGLEEKWQMLREDEELRKQFEAEHVASAEKGLRGAFRAMIGTHARPEAVERFRQTFEQAAANMPEIAGAEEYTNKMIARLDEGVTQAIDRADRIRKAGEERLAMETTSGVQGAMAGVVDWGTATEGGLAKMLEESGRGYVARTFDWMEYLRRGGGFRGLAPEAAGGVAEQQAARLRGESVYGMEERLASHVMGSLVGLGGVVPLWERDSRFQETVGGIGQLARGPARPEDRRTADILETTIGGVGGQFEQINQKLDLLTEATERRGQDVVEATDRQTDRLADAFATGQPPQPAPPPQIIDPSVEPALSY